MKIKSDQILTEKYIYQMNTTVQQFWFSKGRPGGVLEMVFLNVYNVAANSITVLYFIFKHNGEVSRFKYDASLSTKDVNPSFDTLYLGPGDELGIECDGGANADKVEVTAQWIWHKD